MKIDKNKIIRALKKVKFPNSERSIVQHNSISNIQIFDKEVCVDVTIDTPALHIKKKMEVDIIKVIHDEVCQEAIVKPNVKVAVKVKEKVSVIRGEAIPGVANIIAIASGKGGVGKSTITANIAVSLSQMGFSVGVIDADIYGPSMHIMFGVKNIKPEVIKIANKNYIKPVEAHAVKLLSIGFFAESNQAVVWRGPMASKALHQLLKESFWGDLDFMLIDLPPGTGDIHLSLVQSVPVTGSVIITTPQDIALADVRKAVNMFTMQSINIPVLGIVENMSFFIPHDNPEKKYYIFGKQGAKALARELGIPLMGGIPLVQGIREHADKGTPIVLEKGTSTQKLFKKLAQKIVKEVVIRNKTLDPSEVVKITTMAGCSSK